LKLYDYLKVFVGKKTVLNLIEIKKFFMGDPFNLASEGEATSLARHFCEETNTKYVWFDPLKTISAKYFSEQ
jgi:hypothetical protein